MSKNLTSNKKMQRMGACLLPLVVLVGCDLYSDVTVPTTDTTAPVAQAAVWRSEVYEAVSYSGIDPLSYEVSDPNDYYQIIASGMDNGGIKKVTMLREFDRTCTQDPDLAQSATGSLTPMVITQSGTVGSTVSNGQWTGPLVRLSDYATCNPGWKLSSVSYRWHVTVEDFHGNTATHGPAKIHWTP